MTDASAATRVGGPWRRAGGIRHAAAALQAQGEVVREADQVGPAGAIAANSPLAVQGGKAVLDFSDQDAVDEGLEYVAQWNSSFRHSHDVTEAVTAFIEQRPPVFTGD